MVIPKAPRIFDMCNREMRIEKGWSADQKYCISDSQGNKYLLRISPAEQYERKKRQFEQMRQVAALGIPMCGPVEFGSCEEGVYSILGWIDGVDAEEALKAMPQAQQYAYGMDAGRALRAIHSIPAPADLENWEARFNRKMDRKLRMYSECTLKYENGQAFIDFIQTHRHLLKDRPQTYQHGDYHVGNMMIDPQGKLHIIDFDRDDFGDPWEEFNRIVWCAQAAPAFASGMVDGYFEGAVPMEFWRLLALYIASNALSSLPWAMPFGQEEISVMRQQAQEILDWYDNMTCVVPKWYMGRTKHIVSVIIDRPLGSHHPKHPDIYYPVNYGYIPGIIAPDGEEQDAYILGVDVPVTEFIGQHIATIHRKNDVEDKWVVVPEGVRFTEAEIRAATHFQEQHFVIEITLL